MAGVAHLLELERCPALLCPKSPSIPSPSIMSSYCFGFRCLHAHAGIKVLLSGHLLESWHIQDVPDGGRRRASFGVRSSTEPLVR